MWTSGGKRTGSTKRGIKPGNTMKAGPAGIQGAQIANGVIC